MLEDPDSRGSETKTNDVECQKTQEDQNQPRAVETGFHDGTTEQELQRLLTETIITISIVNGANSDQMSRQTNHTRICVVLDSDERDKFVRSANILKKELRGRKIRISAAMDAEERSHQEDLDTSNAASTQDTTYHSCRSK